MNLVRRCRSYWYDKSIFLLTPVVVAFLALILTPVTLSAEAAAEPQEEPNAVEDTVEEDEELVEEPGDEDLSFFGEQTVTATGTAIDTFDIPTPVIVINSERIDELQPNNAAELLRNEPGVDVNGVGPNQARPIIRGQRGLRVLFMENGLRMNNSRRQTDFGEIVGLVDIEFVETMEVVRGAASVLYGTDAIGGVLNLITKVPAVGDGSGVNGSLGLRYSDVDSQFKGGGTVGGYVNNFSYFVGATTRSTDDYDVPAGSFGDITLEEDTVVLDTAIDDDSITGYLGYRFNEKHSIFGKYLRYSAGETGFGFVDPALLGEDTLTRIFYPFQDFDRFTFGYSADGLESAMASTVNVQIYRQENERELGFNIFIPIGAPFGIPSDLTIDTLNFTNLDTWGGRAEAVKAIHEKHLLNYGIEYFNDDSFNTDQNTTITTLRAPFPIDFICGPSGAIPFPFECVFEEFDDIANTPNAENTGSGVFIQDTFWISKRFTAIFGARWGRSETKAKPTPGHSPEVISLADFDDDKVVGALNLTYAATNNLHIVGSIASAFRAPNIIERLFSGPTPEGFGFQIFSPNLVSETSLNYDIGLKYRNKSAYFEVTYFENEIDDAIVQHTLTDEEFAALPPELQDEIIASGFEDTVIQQRNAETLTIKGIEAAGGWAWENGLSIGANYTHLTGQADLGGDAADPTGDTFSDKIAGYLRWSQRKGRYWAEYRVRHNGEQDQVLDPGQDPGPIGPVLPSFTIHTLAAGVTAFENETWAHLFGLVWDNLTDELYSEFSNAGFFRPNPGQSIMLTYRLRVR